MEGHLRMAAPSSDDLNVQITLDAHHTNSFHIVSKSVDLVCLVDTSRGMREQNPEMELRLLLLE